MGIRVKDASRPAFGHGLERLCGASLRMTWGAGARRRRPSGPESTGLRGAGTLEITPVPALREGASKAYAASYRCGINREL